MRLGTSSPLAHTTPEDWAQRQQSLGLQAVNFHLTCGDAPALVDATVAAAQAHGLTIAEVGVWRNMLDPDEDRRQAAIRYTIGQLELADRIGARCCVNILGARGPRWDGAYKQNFTRETWQLGVQTIRQVIDAVNPKNTYFTIESMPWMYPTGPDEYLRLLEDVGRDRFAVHLDVFNWITTPQRYFFNQEFVDECFEKLGPFIKSCHLKDVRLEGEYTLRLRETCPGDGGIDLLHLIRTAERCDPDMPFIIEHLDSDEAYLQSIAHVRKLLEGGG